MRPLAVSASILAVLAACSDDSARTYRVPKEAPPAPAPVAAAPAGAPGVHWHAPKDWDAKPPAQMRVASWSVPGPGGEADASVVRLPGPAGGPLANVNRWRGQVGLGPLADEQALAGASRKVATGAGPALLVDLKGPSARTLAAILTVGGESWFFKLTGSDATVGAAEAAFTRMVRELHPAEGG